MIFIAIGSCKTTEKIVYRDPPPPIVPEMIADPVLQDDDITVNEYLFMIYSIRVNILYNEILKTLKIITDEEYNSYVGSQNEMIGLINSEIEKLKLLE